MRTSLSLATLMLVFGLLVACGQKGALTLPPEDIEAGTDTSREQVIENDESDSDE